MIAYTWDFWVMASCGIVSSAAWIWYVVSNELRLRRLEEKERKP